MDELENERVECPICNGYGKYSSHDCDDEDIEYTKCSSCDGTGTVDEDTYNKLMEEEEEQVTCPACEGSLRMPCETCAGSLMDDEGDYNCDCGDGFVDCKYCDDTGKVTRREAKYIEQVMVKSLDCGY